MKIFALKPKCRFDPQSTKTTNHQNMDVAEIIAHFSKLIFQSEP